MPLPENAALAEFHLHLEAALSWDEYARLVGPQFSRGAASAPWLARAKPFATFEDFRVPWRDYILPYHARPGNYECWIDTSARWLAGLGVRYAEMNVGASLLERLRLPVEETIRAICAAFHAAERTTGVRLVLFTAIKREADPAENARWVERWMEAAGADLVGLDLMGYELDGPTARQKPAYDVARSGGLVLRAHAGEHGTAHDVADAIDILGATSINHGARAAEDPGLLRELARRRIPLHLCPTSNLLLDVIPSLRDFPLRRFLDAGVPVTINSDDPLLFDTDVRQEFERLERALALTAAEVRGLLRTAWECARVAPEERRARVEGL